LTDEGDGSDAGVADLVAAPVPSAVGLEAEVESRDELATALVASVASAPDQDSWR
jgi:hypothetical protein